MSALADPDRDSAVARRALPRYSIALCTYNGAAFLGQQLASILHADTPIDEVVLIDDVSSDRTLEIAAGLSEQTNIFFFIERNDKTLGSVHNFEKALAQTRGHIVFLSDQDDVWRESKAQRLIDEFERRPDLLLLHTDARLVDADGNALKSSLFEALEVSGAERAAIRNGNAFGAFLRRNLATGATMAVRRSLFEFAFPFPDDWVHDEWLAIVAAAIGTVDFIDEQLIDYRQHSRNQIGARRLSLGEKVRKAFQRRGDFYARQERRTIALLERLVSLGSVVPADRIEMVREKVAHARFRASLPRNRLARIVPVVREIMTGRYARYSTGFRSIVRDFFEPA